ncbi:MAG: PIG-L deacetylase family protein [Promethearchaeia archaeon]
MASADESFWKDTVLFFVPHADDLEFGISSACIEFLRRGYTVKEILMTDGQYGTERSEFKGTRLKRIRMQELEDVNKIYETELNNHPELIKMGYLDGFLPLTRQSVARCTKLILREKARIIFAPDPIYSIDFHNDHINSGRIPLFSLRSMANEYRAPHIFLYYTYNSNFLLKVHKENTAIGLKALKQHRSQMSLRKFAFLSKLLKIRQQYQVFKYGSPVQKLREVGPDFDSLFQFTGDMKLRDLFLYDFFYHAANPSREIYQPSPKELGLIN